jgi:hypothetical protein
MSGGVDLPHQPSTVEYLRSESKLRSELFCERAKKAKEAGGLKLKYYFHHKAYGAKINIIWLPSVFCKCAAKNCPERRYHLHESIFRVKDDYGLVALDHYLECNLKFAEKFVPKPDFLC